ncbi:MAG: tetratricopeptide repeat protein [Pseudomonadota bacterium]
MLRSFFKKPLAIPLAAASDTELANKLILEGNQFEDAGQLARACALYRQAISSSPRFAKGYLNLGIALAASGDASGAANAYEEVLRIEPDNAYGNYNFARLTYLSRDLAKTEALLQRSLLTKPDFFEALVLLSSVLEETARMVPALEALTKALQLKPDSGGAWTNQAVLLLKLDKPEDAEKAARCALTIDPLDVQALQILASILRSLGFNDEASLTLNAALRIQPEKFDLQSTELFLLNFDEKLPAEEIFQRHAAFGARMEAAFPVRFKTRRDTAILERRLRVGYVSGDFNSHPVAQFMLPVLERHDHNAFEIFCYSCGSRKDAVTEKISSLCNRWTDVSTLSDRQLADTIHQDGIDILVDLSGHSGSVKLAVFSERPAAIQATWLGYLNTSGLSRMDYRICDARTDPEEWSGKFHTEKLIHLPASQWCYRPVMDMHHATSAPVQRNGHVTFGSFNSGLKISTPMCRRWAEILVAVPGSRLLIADVKSERKQEAIKFQMRQFGASIDCIQFMPRMDLPDYFKLYNSVDIALDTSPYGGGTTTFDALWMGVPVVTAKGNTPVSRSAASILEALNLTEWIAPSIDDYVRTAVQRASDPAAIQSLRQSLRPLLMDSPLTDEKTFVKDLEARYVAMWANFCASGSPSSR